jgi:YD repeat-containing protein
LVRVVVALAAQAEIIVTAYRTSKIDKYGENAMKVNYDGETDALTVIFRDGPVAESDEGKPGVILDYDDHGNLLSIEVLDASVRVHEPQSVTLTA